MVTHVVLLQLKATTTAEEINVALKHLHTLQETIPGIIDVQSGANIARQQNFTYGFVMHFTDRAHLDVYKPHPAHQAVAKELRQLCDALTIFDLE